MTQAIICYRCNGDGLINTGPDAWTTCTHCFGRGSIGPIEVTIREAVTTVPCPTCQHCAGCGGAHMVTPARAVELRKAARR